ncbi:MAG: nuclear transport factor 2 family protein [Planctomycetota bacterium]
MAKLGSLAACALIVLIAVVGSLGVSAQTDEPHPSASSGAPESTGGSEVEAAVIELLDRFYSTAATADFDGYFDCLDSRAIFLGTDATERWTVDQFKEFARPHFQGDSAWEFRPTERNLSVGPDASFVWFDERLESKSYGECRGSGVAYRVDGKWKLGQYHLTVPVPNGLLRSVVAQIRGETLPATRVVVVRHAEKDTSDSKNPDPELTPEGKARAEALAAALAELPLDAVFHSEFRRTRDTVTPAAEQHGKTPVEVPARQVSELARRILRDHAGQTVLVGGHSNTVPVILRALGVPAPVTLSESDYGDVFFVSCVRGRPATLFRIDLPSTPEK